MAMGKALADPARNIDGSSVVTAMSRNGTDFGIRVSGTGDRWFTAPVEMPVGLYFPGFSERDANPDMGDSAIVETVGLGGFAMAAAPAVVGYVGAGRASEAAAFTRVDGGDRRRPQSRMDHPGDGFRRRADRHRHSPRGRDRRSCRPSIPGSRTASRASGRSAPASSKAPLKCFEEALVAFAETMGVE